MQILIVDLIDIFVAKQYFCQLFVAFRVKCMVRIADLFQDELKLFRLIAYLLLNLFDLLDDP